MGFHPKFVRVKTLAECADLINKPHEDYPLRVDATEDMLKYWIGEATATFDEHMLLETHGYIMFGEAFRGAYRNVNVRVGGHLAPSFLSVPDLMKSIMPVYLGLDKELVEWYTRFQEIHPFQDGNGRVGGVIVAVLSWDGKTLMSPCQ